MLNIWLPFQVVSNLNESCAQILLLLLLLLLLLSMETAWDRTFLGLDLNLDSRQLSDEFPKVLERNFMEVGSKISAKKEADILEAELDRMSKENEKLYRMLGSMYENYSSLQNQLIELLNRKPENSKKRKTEIDKNSNNVESTSSADSCKKPREEQNKIKVSRVCVRTDASNSSLIVKDGYQWRKYGQKVTRDNPSPRAYYKCSFAPTCPVKKKVQRSAEDRTVLVATYEGEHNHVLPSAADPHSCSVPGSSDATASWFTRSVSMSSSRPTVTLDLTQYPLTQDAGKNTGEIVKSPELQSSNVQPFLVEQMASSLTKDPGFTAALAAAVSGRIFRHPPSNNW